MLGVGAVTWWMAGGREGLRDAGWSWGKPKDYLLAWFIAALIWVPGLVVDAARGATTAGPHPVWQSAFMVVLAVAVYPVLGFGEEIAWRGYLLPLLAPQGVRRAIVLVGIVWGVWHWPLLLGELFTKGSEKPMVVQAGVAVLMLLGNLLLSVASSALFAWVWSRSRSIAVVAFLHGEYDGVRDVLHFVFSSKGHVGAILPALTTLIIGIVLLWKGKFKELERLADANHVNEVRRLAV